MAVTICFRGYLAMFFLLFGLTLCNENVKNSTFIPTNEWQKVNDGQAIPAGLHVRINMHTGEKEAKLYKNDDTKKNAVLNINPEDTVEKLNTENLKEMMKNIKGDDGKPQERSFRSYEKLKKDFNELNIQVKTDIEILTELVDNFQKLTDKSNENKSSIESEDEELLTTLVDLEYLVHQFDNALEFARLNGFTEVVFKSLNSTNSDVRSEALRLHGSATQSNPKVQVSALESGSVQLLLKILAFDDDVSVRSRSLYALSCLLRRFPLAQNKFVMEGGLTVFADIFDNKKQDLSKLQIKIMTLINDLIFERKDLRLFLMVEKINTTDSKTEETKERLRQYEVINFEHKLVEQGWCKRISEWFLSQNFNIKSDVAMETMSQTDVVEKVADTLIALSDVCLTTFQQDTKLVAFLNYLKDIYTEIAAKEDRNDSYFVTLSNVLQILTEKLSTVKEQKDEL